MYGNEHMDESVEFDRYLIHDSEDHPQDARHKNLPYEEISMEINSINNRLKTFWQYQERLGDLTNPSTKEIKITLQFVQALMNQVKKTNQFKNKLISQKRALEQRIDSFEAAVDKLARQKKSLEIEKENAIQKIKNIEKIHKENIQKVQSEKEDLFKQLTKIQQREKTFEAEFRKKQTRLKQFQDMIKKYQNEKPGNLKNSFDVIQKFDYGPSIYTNLNLNGEHQYSRLATNSKQLADNRLAEQNKYLKECLINVYKELNTVLQLKKQTLKNKRGYDGEYENSFDLNNINTDTFNLPVQWSRERLKQLNENIHKFKQAIKIGDSSDARVNQKKQGCINGIKQVIQNYKQVMQTQDQLLNKVILKSKQFKATEMMQLQNRFSKAADNGQIERARKFVEEQSQYLQSKNFEIEKTRKMMQAAMKKAEESKRDCMKKKQMLEEEAMQIKKSVEILPALIEEQLNKALH